MLTRRAGQSVLIGDGIRVTVADVYPTGEVRLRIEAPADVAIAREELGAPLLERPVTTMRVRPAVPPATDPFQPPRKD